MFKSFSFVGFLILSSSISFSQTKGSVQHPFPKILDWEATIEKATLDNKYIMVDLSTEWCSSCKVAEKKLFTDQEILNLMQPKLNSYVLDAEKDSVGQLLKLKYGVCSYPSFLFFTPRGEYLETWVGTMPREYWIQYIKDSVDSVPISRPGIPSGLEFQWPVFVERELKNNFRKSTPQKEELDSFFSTCNPRSFVDFNVCRFYPGDIPDSLLYELINDQVWLNQNYGMDLTSNLISTSFIWKIYAEIQNENWSRAQEYMSEFQIHFPEDKWELFNAKLFYYQTKLDVDGLIKLGVENPDYVSEHIALEMIEFIYKFGSTVEHFRQASIWNRVEFEKSASYDLAKIQALLNFKLNDLVETRRWIEIAKEKANDEGIKVESDAELKNLIRTIGSR